MTEFRQMAAIKRNPAAAAKIVAANHSYLAL
jgi:hypothetical protein